MPPHVPYLVDADAAELRLRLEGSRVAKSGVGDSLSSVDRSRHLFVPAADGGKVFVAQDATAARAFEFGVLATAAQLLGIVVSTGARTSLGAWDHALSALRVGESTMADVRSWLAANRRRLELFRLPPYSPEFNPIEGVWKQTKKRTTHNIFLRTTDERDAALTATFESFRARPSLIAAQVARFV